MNLSMTDAEPAHAHAHAHADARAEAEAAPDAPSDTALLDPQALAVLSQLDPSGSGQLFLRVMSTYRKSLARLVGQMQAAREPFDPDALRLAVHTLKLSSGSVGALALARLCGLAEAELREGRFDALPPLLDALLTESARVESAVSHLLPSA